MKTVFETQEETVNTVETATAVTPEATAVTPQATAVTTPQEEATAATPPQEEADTIHLPATATGATYPPATAAKPLALVVDVEGDLSHTDVAKQIATLKPSAVDVAANTWSPKEVGESKMLLFLGGEVKKMPKLEGEGEIFLPYANLMEGYVNKDGEAEMRSVQMSAGRITQTFLITEGNPEEGTKIIGYTKPLNSVWFVEFLGTEPSKKNPSRQISKFSIKLPVL